MKRLLLSISLLLSFAMCISSASFAKKSYVQISMDEAREMMEKDDGHVVVDVSRRGAYGKGHIPGAICIPCESIGCDSPEALPDYDQIILIYGRSRKRSKKAARKLAGMGYTRIYEFGEMFERGRSR